MNSAREGGLLWPRSICGVELLSEGMCKSDTTCTVSAPPVLGTASPGSSITSSIVHQLQHQYSKKIPYRVNFSPQLHTTLQQQKLCVGRCKKYVCPDESSRRQTSSNNQHNIIVVIQLYGDIVYDSTYLQCSIESMWYINIFPYFWHGVPLCWTHIVYGSCFASGCCWILLDLR